MIAKWALSKLELSDFESDPKKQLRYVLFLQLTRKRSTVIFIIKQLLNCIKFKSIFDDLENRDLRQARSRSNPFESIAACFFQNRAAMKMANIDAVFDFMFTDPKNSYGVCLLIPRKYTLKKKSKIFFN